MCVCVREGVGGTGDAIIQCSSRRQNSTLKVDGGVLWTVWEGKITSGRAGEAVVAVVLAVAGVAANSGWRQRYNHHRYDLIVGTPLAVCKVNIWKH